MKTIAILALTAAALVSCQQQGQPEDKPIDKIEVTTQKGK